MEFHDTTKSQKGAQSSCNHQKRRRKLTAAEKDYQEQRLKSKKTASVE